jgi:hypothetical protein
MVNGFYEWKADTAGKKQVSGDRSVGWLATWLVGWLVVPNSPPTDQNNSTQPYYVHLKPTDDAETKQQPGKGGGNGGGEQVVMRMAGLWDSWTDPDGQQVGN